MTIIQFPSRLPTAEDVEQLRQPLKDHIANMAEDIRACQLDVDLARNAPELARAVRKTLKKLSACTEGFDELSRKMREGWDI